MNLSSLFSQLFGQAADHIPIDNPEVAQAIRVLSKVQMHLQSTWRQSQRMGMHCEQRARSANGEILRCVEPMSNVCIACRRPVCLHHAAFVPETGDLICFGCIGLAQQSVRANGPSNVPPHASAGGQRARTAPDDAAEKEKLRKKYMKRLKLTGDPTEDEIRSAFKAAAAKAHPDKAPPAQRQKAHEKFVALGEARDWLLANMRKKAA